MTLRPGNEGAFTLVELLAVLVIISLLGGLSAGAFQLARRNYALSASASSVEGIIRAARNSSVSSGVPSRVVIDPVAGEAIAYGFETVGEWSFEEAADGATHGARGAPAVLKGGAALGKGHAGGGLSLGGGAHADCGALSVYDLRAGVHAEAWIRWSASDSDSGSYTAGPPAGEGGGTRRRAKSGRAPARPAPVDNAAAIISKGGSYFLGIGKDGALEGRVGDYRLRTSPGAVIPGRWTRVALWYDGEEALLLADGIARDTYLPDAPAGGKTPPRPPPSMPPSAEPLLIGGKVSFSGEIDEVRLHGMVEPLSYALGGRERFLGWRQVIRFDRRGRLDSRFHETGLQVVICSEEDVIDQSLRTEAAADYSVTFAEWNKKRGKRALEGEEAGELARLQRKHAGARQVVIAIDPSGALR